MNLFVGNLSYDLSEDDLRQAFGAFGEVASATIIMDRDTGRSKGFGFVEMPDGGAAQAAMNDLNGKEMGGRKITVNEARPRAEGGRQGGGRKFGGGGGGGGGHRGGGQRY
jgi:RNA recognition motif-containing protein